MRSLFRARLLRARRESGGLLPEFASAFVILVLCLLIPLANLSAVPIRYVIAYGMVSDLTHRLALQETRSRAVVLAGSPTSYQDLAARTGVVVDDCNVQLVVQSPQNQIAAFPGRQPIPAEWLPGGSRGQCSYVLETQTELTIAPLLCLGPKIPALTSPVKMTISTRSPWENLGQDPITQAYYINE